MTQALTVTAATPADLAAVLPLLHAYYAASPVPHTFADAAMTAWLTPLTQPDSPRGRLLLARPLATGEVAGFALCYLGGNTRQLALQVELHDLFVAAAWRRRGVARQLLAATRTYAQQVGAQNVIWQTRVSNTGAQALYDAVGRREQGWLHYSMPAD